MSTYEFKQVLHTETWPLRAAVLWPEKSAGPSCELPSDTAEGTLHFGAFRGADLVSIASFSRQSHTALPDQICYRLRAMATSEAHRQSGAGRMVIDGAMRTLGGMEVEGVWADARHVALGFYARLGWDVVGPTYEVPLRGPHRLVWRRI